MIIIQIANRGFLPFTTVDYVQYTEPVREELKTKLRKDELKMIGLLPDDSNTFDNEESLKQAFEKN